MDSLEVNEIFTSVMGEVNGIGGQGLWAIFLRLQGCNLNCSYCDTQYAREYGKGIKFSTRQIVDRILTIRLRTGINKILITGGEPFARSLAAVAYLCSKLQSEGFYLAMETNGSIDFTVIGEMEFISSFIIDYKLSNSNMKERMTPLGLEFWNSLTKKDYIKFVISDIGQLEEVNSIVTEIREENNMVNFFISPTPEANKEKLLPAMIAKEMFNVGINLQIHKILEAE